MCLHAKSCLTLCDPVDCSPPGSSVRGIFQARVLEWVALPFCSGSSQPRDQTQVSCIAGRFFTIWATGEIPLDLIGIIRCYTQGHSQLKSENTNQRPFHETHIVSSLLYVNLSVTISCVCAQLCLTFNDPMDCSPQGFSVDGISQARILEWVAVPSFRGSSQPRDWTLVSWKSPTLQADSWLLSHRGSPRFIWCYFKLFVFSPYNNEFDEFTSAVSCNFFLFHPMIFFPSGCSELWYARITYPNTSGFTNFSYIFHVLSCFQAQWDFLFLAGLPIVIPSSLWPLIGKLWHLERTFLKTVGILVFGPDVKRILIEE